MSHKKYILYAYTLLTVTTSSIKPSDEANRERPYSPIQPHLPNGHSTLPADHPTIKFEKEQQRKDLLLWGSAAALVAGIWMYIWGPSKKSADTAQQESVEKSKSDTGSPYNTADDASSTSSSAEDVPE